MINTTDNLIYLKKEEKIIYELRKSLLETRNLIINEYGLKEIPSSLNNSNKNLAFVFHFTEDKIKDIYLDIPFLNKILNFIFVKDSENICFTYGFCSSNLIIEHSYLKSALKISLLSLWKKDILLLPLFFNTSNVSKKIELLYDNSIINHFQKYFINNKNNYSEAVKSSFINNTTRIIRTTNYKTLADFNIIEVNRLHIFIMNALSGREYSILKSGHFNIELILTEIKSNISEFEFDKTKYRSWLNGFHNRLDLNYIEYLKEFENIKEIRRLTNLEQTKNRKNINKSEVSNNTTLYSNVLEQKFLSNISKPRNWLYSDPIYNGYEHLEYNENKLWINLFNSYLDNRKNNGYETVNTQHTVFNLLMDYIFFYLNAWNKENFQWEPLPLSPKDFKRVLYIKNIDFNKKRPFTLMELIKERPNSYKNTVLFNLESFFNYIADNYDENKDIWEMGSIPVKKSDYFIIKKDKKTNKVIIPKKTYSYLKQYLKSIEMFGDYLFNLSLEHDYDQNIQKQKILDSEKLGYIPFLNINNKNIPIYNVPNLYQWRNRTFNINQILQRDDIKIINRFIPSNTLIRAYILTLNTGLRSAQVLWLDKRFWDKDNDNTLQAYYNLNINTDKFKDRDWSTFVSHTVRESLKKETIFQNSMQENFMNLMVNYKSREHTRFEPILPLFRSNSKTGEPFKYMSYLTYWNELLLSFQNFLNSNLEEKYHLVNMTRPKTIKILGDQNKYCQLSVSSIHTPHSMRATFCTHMSEYLERSEIANLVGHSNDLVTSEVYIKPEESTLILKIEKAMDIFDNSVNSDYFDINSKAHIKPNISGSALQKAFTENREQTIELFNISSISLNINKENEQQNKKAINLLKEARMDHIIFETTHICPVGGICPQDVMNIISEKRRCGLCPLALKCIDNLNPIYAKQRDLIREIKNGKEQLELSIKNKDSEISIHNIEDKVNLDIRELVSWKFSADVLSKYYEELKLNKDLGKKYYVEMPDIVKNHLIKVSVSTEKEYLLTRIADAQAYSSSNNPENRYKADMIKRQIIKNLDLIEYNDYHVSDNEKIEVFCSMIKHMMDTNGVTLKKLVEYNCFKRIENAPQKHQSFFLKNPIKLIK